MLIDRFGPRRLMMFGITLMGTGFIILSRVDSLVGFYIVFVLVVSLGSSFGAGQAIVTHPGEWIRYSTPEPDGAEYIAICLPAFSPATVHRDD